MNKSNRTPKARAYKRPQLTSFIICQHQQGCWIASEKHGHVTGLFPVDLAVAGVSREDKPARRR